MGMSGTVLRTRWLLATTLFLGCVTASALGDVVILKDGFVIQGHVRKEMEPLRDSATGRTFTVPKASGFDMIDEGPKVVIFSTHAKQLGEIGKDVKLRPEYRAFANPILARRGNNPIPPGGTLTATPDFNDKWKRTIEIRWPGGFDRVEQQVTYLDPYCCFVVSTTHSWSQTFRTSEMDPLKVRKLLTTHPDLVETDGKCDPSKRIAIARFLKEAGWLYLAKEELELLKKDHPGALSKDHQDLLDKFMKEVDQATADLVVTEAEHALNAGRYQYTGDLLATFPEKLAAPGEVDRATRLMAQHKLAMERYRNARRLLRNILDELTGSEGLAGGIAVGGGSISSAWPTRAIPSPRLAMLATAGEEIYNELHPDSAGRVEFFVNLAIQVERERGMGKQASKTHEELLATVVSGWVKGKNGASTLAESATRVWDARRMVLNYQRAPNLNGRRDILLDYKKAAPLGIDELAQIISLLPPAQPENLTARTGTLVPVSSGAPPECYRRKSGSTGDHPTGIEYLVKLPPEYHHGRAYPVLIALAHPGMEPAEMVRALNREAERNGYILVAPDWANLFGKGWQWKGADHDYVTGVLRDVIRHFCVDNDRVFLLGMGDGGNMAMDVGMSHPDLFAGVLAMCPNPKWQGMFMQYWPNAQKLPCYLVTGELATTAFQSMRLIFQNWMPRGFPGMLVAYKGRGSEWFPAEVPVMFDWMNRKKRATPASTLKLETGQRLPWQMMRMGDNRFFWLGADKIDSRKLIENLTPGVTVIPATILGDVQGNNVIRLDTQGVRTVTIWLTRDMIDWSQPVRVTLNNSPPYGWRPKVLTPDLDVLLEDYWERGDRRMLFLAKLEFQSGN